MTDTTSHTPSAESRRTRADEELPASLAGLVGRVEPADLRETVRRVFADLTHLLERLRAVEDALSPQGPFDGPLSDLKQVQAAAEKLYGFIKSRVEELERGGGGAPCWPTVRRRALGRSKILRA